MRSHLLIANDSTNEPFVQKVENLTKAQLTTLLNNPTSTFVYAYEAKQGEGSLNLYRAAKHAKDLGMTKEQIVELIEDINNYWEYPMDHSRLEKYNIKSDKELEMSTPCFIGKVDNKTDDVRFIYCHFDGYPEDVGYILDTYYKDQR